MQPRPSTGPAAARAGAALRTPAKGASVAAQQRLGADAGGPAQRGLVAGDGEQLGVDGRDARLLAAGDADLGACGVA
jgi:hypothetical protein